MAAWYVFSSLDFYPVTAGSGQYVIGLSLWDKATVHLSSGNDLEISAEPNYPQQMFIESLTFNDQQVTRTFLTQEQLTAGGQLDFKLGIVPHPRDFSDDELPYSLSK